ncbi:WHG domain-containing protein [Actinomadura barringtoniae]|uniref:WHG domain-containing protein n=1 Tax=Actinomadura barringtoniae TaxID=1427535 RepID=A0A939T7B8_9ACTN|nr:TetR-like C-terminal domain-containing protein [Actinomadura barringtoniae]MBO2451839.1 WHG domain-containing protein [Actinomadura barringtoniae]
MRTRNPRGHGERLRAELLAAAGELLEEAAEVDGPSLRAVARAAGVAPQSVYLQFADMNELLGALFEERFAELAAELSAAASGAASAAASGDAPGAAAPRARVRAVCLAYCSFAERRPGLYRLLFSSPALPRREPGGPAPQRGMPALKVLDDAVRECLPSVGAAVPSSTTLCLWAAMHGLVLLRGDRPNVGWPDLESLIDEQLAAHLSA